MIESMRYSLQDYGENISKEKFRENIKDELYEDVAHYANGHVGDIRKLLNDAEQYFAHGSIKYTSDVVDVTLCTAANAIKANVGIFQNIGGKALVIFNHCTKTVTETSTWNLITTQVTPVKITTVQ